jgi:hypothetical protein
VVLKEDGMTKTLLGVLCVLAACGPAKEQEPTETSGDMTTDAGPPPAPHGFACAPAADGSVRTYPSAFGPNVGMHVGQTFPDFELGQGYWDMAGAVPSSQMPLKTFDMHDLFCSSYKLALIHIGTRWCAHDLEEWASTTPQLADWASQGGVVLSVVLEGQDRQPASPADLNYLEGEYPGNQMVLDPETTLAAAYGLEAFPLNVVVELSRMEVIALGTGYERPNDPVVAEFVLDLK